MKKQTLPLFLMTLLGAGSASAYNCDLSNALNFSAYAINSMSVTSSDFQGLVGAGNSISASFFHFGPMTTAQCGITVSVGNHFAGTSGYSDGAIEITNPGGTYNIARGGYNNFSVAGVQASRIVNHAVVARHIEDLSRFYKSLPASGARASVANNKLTITLGRGDIQVVHLTRGQVGPSRNIEIFGNPSQTLIINVPGSDVMMTNMLLKVNGLNIRNMIWNFSEATSLTIARMGGLNSTLPQGDEFDRSWGLQGFIIAPYANTTFSMSKITGSLWVSNIATGTGHTGQINLPPVQGPDSPCLTINHPECRPEVAPPPVPPTPPKPPRPVPAT